jgi:hypothetical protein
MGNIDEEFLYPDPGRPDRRNNLTLIAETMLSICNRLDGIERKLALVCFALDRSEDPPQEEGKPEVLGEKSRYGR